MLGWLRLALIFASRMNIETNLGLWARSGRMRLMTSRFSKPAAPKLRARNTSAIPPGRDAVEQLVLAEPGGEVHSGASGDWAG
jgi:hypothetical protein